MCCRVWAPPASVCSLQPVLGSSCCHLAAGAVESSLELEQDNIPQCSKHRCQLCLSRKTNGALREGRADALNVSLARQSSYLQLGVRIWHGIQWNKELVECVRYWRLVSDWHRFVKNNSADCEYQTYIRHHFLMTEGITHDLHNQASVFFLFTYCNKQKLPPLTRT